ncbi:hypothetical protein LDENG_00105120 [Lucifuga dentata]|nr:hypothetical protein LDENG_00105120 [Lucifuga dentata]
MCLRSMKLRVRINTQTSRVELQGENPSLTHLLDHIRQHVLTSHGLSSDSEFRLSLDGSEPLSDSGQSLSSCGVVSGDLIHVILPETLSAAATFQPGSSGSQDQPGHAAATMTTNQKCSDDTEADVSGAAAANSEEEEEEEDDGASACSWEPMLCGEAEDGQAPLSLELLFHLSSSRSDALVLAAHVLMLETGFTPQGCELKPGEMPGGWRAAGSVYQLQYTHPLCESSLAVVLAVPMGALLVINATLKLNDTVDTVRKLCLSPSSYLTDDWPGESAAAAFRDLSKLSRIFKDQLVYPLIAAAREAMSLPVAFGLAALPPELLLRILRLLDVRSVLRLASACRHFYSATADSTLWRHLYRRDFRDSERSRSRDADWKQLYKVKYKSRRQSRRFFSHPCAFPPIVPNPIHPFGSEPIPLFPPGVIGGEYDERPNVPRGILPRPRYDPIRPFPDGNLDRRFFGQRGVRPMSSRPSDIRRGFI